MGPITRSSRRNQTSSKNVLADKTNVPRMSEIDENKERKSSFSHTVEKNHVNEDLKIYDFISTNSPPRKVAKKRKPRHKKKPLSKSDEVVFKIKKLENINYKTRQVQAISSYGKNGEKSVSSILTSSDKRNIMPIVEGNENKPLKQNKENNSAVREMNEYVVRNKATVKSLDTNAPHDSCVSAGGIQNTTCIITDSENKENYSETDFRHSFGFSPIQCENRDFYITKRPKRRRCVEDFTIENCFGFDEPDDEVKSPESRSVLFPKSSTPRNENKVTHPNEQVSQILLPVQSLNKSSEVPTNKKDNICVKSVAAFSLSSEEKNSASTQNILSGVTSTKCLEGTSRKLPQDKCTKTQEVTSTEISQVRSTSVSKRSPVLFGDDLEEQHFNKPPRRSYERKSATYWKPQPEAECDSENEICNTEKNKSSKKRKVKQDKIFTEWAANVSAEFEEVDSFQLCVE